MPEEMDDDCIILVADNDIRDAIDGLLSRPQAVPMRAIRSDFIVHPQRDPGVRTKSREMLERYRRTHRYALAVLDHEGCGGGKASAAEVETQIESSCEVDWGDRIRAIAIEPEVESWVWSDSPRVDEILGWAGRTPDLRDWLIQRQHTAARFEKPNRPKEAFDAAIRHVQKPRSSTLFKKLGEKVSVERCKDRAFGRLRETLRSWFPIA